MERICPFLALEDDARTAMAGYDPRHRCGAVRPSERLERQQQLSTCLIVDHRSCPRHIAALAELRARDAWSRPAEDAGLVSTRLVLGPDLGGRGMRSMAGGPSPARWGLGAAAAVAGIAALGGISAAVGALPGAGSAPSVPADTPSVTQEATPLPAVGEPSPRPPQATPAATPSAVPTPSPTRQATPAPTGPPQTRTYVVQPGDTLAAIAVRFGTSVSALEAANDLADTDVILIGQVLVIP